jgi:DNA-directed RNA polymerase specialized sigma24 family protein
VLDSFGGLSADEILKRIETSLSDYEKQVFKEYFSDRSARETALLLGTDEKSVNNAVYRIRQKAKSLGAVKNDM